MRKAIGAALLAVVALALVVYAQSTTQPSVLSAVAGTYNAGAYSSWRDTIAVPGGGSINPGTGVSIPLRDPVVRLSDGRTIIPFYAGVRVTIGAGAAAETVAITSASGCYLSAQPASCTLVVTTANQHGNGEPVTSGSVGLDEALLDAASGGTGLANPSGSFGGEVDVDAAWQAKGGTSAIINGSTIIFPLIYIKDARTGPARYWNITPTGLALAVPAAPTSQAACDATHQTCSDATVAGSASFGSTVYTCVAYVDIMGNEGPCSLASSVFTSVASKAIDVGPPAASSGAVGYIPYVSLSGGSYIQAYSIPSLGTYCTLTTLENVTPACAVTNSKYGQVASTFGADALFNGGAQITVYPLVTSQHFTALASVVQTTASLTPMTNSSLTYAYAPSNRVGACPGMTPWNQTQNAAAGGISASSTTGIPMSIGTFTVPAGCFNYVGAEFRVAGKFVETPGGASDALKAIVAWDSVGSNSTTALPTTLCSIANTHTEAGAQQTGNFTCTVKILTTGASGTALANGWGYFDIATGSAGVLIGGANELSVAASSAINLTAPARIAVRFTNTGSTVTATQGIELSLELLN